MLPIRLSSDQTTLYSLKPPISVLLSRVDMCQFHRFGCVLKSVVMQLNIKGPPCPTVFSRQRLTEADFKGDCNANIYVAQVF